MKKTVGGGCCSTLSFLGRSECAGCWLFLTILRIIFAASDHAENCTRLEFGGLEPKMNWTEIEENNYINLTAHPQDTSRCETNNQTVLQIKISYQQINIDVDICKFILKTVCEVSDSSNASSTCKCLNSRTVQFFKKASSSDSKLYTWKWRHGNTPEKQRDIFITVKNTTDNPSDEWSAATTSTVVCVLLLVVVVATAGVVIWLHFKVKCSIEVKDCGLCYNSSGCDTSADIQVNGQAFIHVDNPYYSDFKDHVVNTNYADVQEQDVSQNFDPNYPDVKEQDMSQPLESSCYESNSEQPLYAYVKKHDKRQPRDPTNAIVKGQDASQPLEPYYADVEGTTTNHNDDPNHTNDTEHDERQHYHSNYVDVKEQDASQPIGPSYKEVDTDKKTDEPTYAYVEKQNKSQSLDPT